jgi:hypothetical protein
MKTSNLCEAMLLAGLAAFAANAGTNIVLCLETRALVSPFVMESAKALASRIFSEAGFGTEWRGPTGCRESGSIRIRIEDDAPAHVRLQVMAHALPYGDAGTAIDIFYNRVVANNHDAPGQLLGHVMAHEIAHVVQGVVRHSETGLMKPHWGSKDYYAMHARPLAFAEEDVELLRMGLETRAAKILASKR